MAKQLNKSHNANQQITFSLGFDTSKSKASLEETKRYLTEIQSMTSSELMDLNKGMGLDEAKKALKEMRIAATDLKQAFLGSFNEDLGMINVTKFNAELAKSGVTLSDIGRKFSVAGEKGRTAFRNLAVETLTTEKSLKKTHSLLDEMATTMANTAKWTIASSAMNNLSGAVQKAVSYVEKLDTSLNNIMIVTGKSSDQMASFAKEANKAAKVLGSQTTTYTDAALIYYQQGLGEEETKARAETTVKAANVTGQTGEQVSEQLTAVWNGYKVSAEETELYVDKLAKVAAGTAADLEELSTGMSKVASAANTAGVDVDQLNATLATVISVTREAPETIGTAFKTIYARMGDLSLDGQDEYGVSLGTVSGQMEELGIQILDETGNMREMGDIIEDTAEKWNTWTAAQKQAAAVAMGGKMQYSRLMALFENWDMYEDALNMSKDATGELQNEQDIYMESTEAHLQKMTASFQDLYDSILGSDDINFFADTIAFITDRVTDLVDGLGGGTGVLLNLGSIGAKVFKKQIAESINISISNLKSLIDKTKDAATEMSYLDMLENIKIETPDLWTEDLENLLSVRKEFGDYADVLTEKESNEALALIKTKNEIINQKNAYEESLTAAKNYYEQYSGKKFDETELDTKIDKPKDSTEQAKTLTSWSKELEGTSRKAKLAAEQLDSLSVEIRKGEKSADKATDTFKSFSALLEEIKKATNDLGSNTGSKFAKELEDLKKFQNDLFTENENLTTDDVENLEDLLVVYVNKVKETYKGMAEEAQKASEVIQQNATGTQKNLEDQMENVDGALEKFRNVGEERSKTQGMVELAAGIGQVSTALTTLTSLWDIWNSSDYSFGEKILKTFESLTFTIPMVVSGIRSIGTNAPIAAASLGLITLNEQGVAVAANGVALSATEMWAAILGPVTLIVAAIGAVAYSIYEIAKAYNADADAAKQASEQAQIMTECYEELQTAAEDLKSTISDYSDAIEQLNSLTEGTDDYSSALETANEKAKELIETYKLYDDYYTENGVIKFKDGVLENAQSQADSSTSEAERKMYSSKIAANQAQTKSNITDTARSSGYSMGKIFAGALASILTQGSSIGLSMQNSDVFLKMSQTEVKATAQALNQLKEATGEEYDIIIQDNEQLKENLLNLEGVDQSVKDNINTIISNKEAFIDLTESINEATTANKYYVQQIMGTIIEDKYGSRISELATETNEEGETVVNEARARQIQSILTESNNGLAEEMTKAIEEIDTSNIKRNSDLKGISDDKDLALTYVKEVLGYEDTSKYTYKRGWNKGTVKDETGKDIISGVSDDVMRQEIARVRAEEKIKSNYGSQVDDKALLDSVEKLMSGAKNLGEKYGTDFTDSLLNSITAEDGKIDLSNIFADLTPSEYLDLAELSTDPEKLQEALGLSDEDLANFGKNSAIEFAYAFQEGLQGYEWNIGDAISNAIEKDSTDLEKNNIDTDEIAAYTRQIMVMSDENEDFADSLEEDAEKAEEVAKSFMIMNDGIEELADNWEDWEKILKKNDKTSEKYAIALDGVKESMSKILGVEKDAFTDDFIEDHFAEISKAAEGDEEAIESLRSSLQDSIIANVLLDSGFTEEKIAELKNQFNELENRFGDLQLGVTLNGDDQLVQDLQKVIDAAGMTEEEANEYLQSISMTPTYEQEEIKETKTVPTYEVTPSIKMEEKDFGPLGKHKIPSGISFKVTQGSTEEFTGKTTLGAITTNGTTPKIKTITKTGGSAKYNTYSSINPGSGSPGGSSSSSSNSEPQTKDLNEDEKDRYEKVNVQLDKISASLSKLQSQEDKLLGQKLVNNLNAQLTELNKKIDKTNEKLKIAQQEQAELQSKLGGYGITFDSEGVMTNYAEVFDRQQAALNAVYNHYNSLSADAQEGYEATVEAAEKRWEKFKDAVSDYDTLIGSTIPDLEQDIQDTIDEKIEIQIKEFDMSIDLSLDIKDAQDTWNDFRKKIIKDLEDTDILGNALDSLERFADYYNQQGLGVIQQEIDHLNKLMGEVDKYNATGWSTVYGDDEQSMMEDLKEYYEQTMDDLESVKDLVDEIHDKMNETLEDIADEMDQQTSYYDAVKDTLEHDMQLVNLVYGEAAYDKLALYYEQLSQNLNSQLEFQKATVDFWKTQMDTLEEGSEEWETARDNWMSAVSDWQSLVEEAIENLTDKYLNSINEIFENLNNKVTNGSGLDYMNSEWELIKKNADQYLDTINAAYGIQQLQNKYLDAIDSTDSISAQQKLNKLMKEQIDALKQQDKLTQYDLDRAELKYQIAVKQIALQEAQQNKSTMRLKRDSQGNYSYQYVADDDQVSQVQQEISDLYNQLYNLDVDQYQGNLDQIYEIWVEYQEKMKEAAQINDPEARLQKEQLLTQQYGELINGLVSQNETIKQNLYESTFLELEDLYGKQSETVTNFLQNQDDVMSLLVAGWSSGLQEMADEIIKEGGFESTYEDTIAKIQESTQIYEDELKKLQETAQVSFDSLGKDISTAQQQTQDLINSTDQLIGEFANEVNNIQNVINQIDVLNDMYQRQSNAIQTVTDAYNKYIQAMNNARNAATQASDAISGNGSSSSSSSGSSSGSSSAQSNPYSGYPLGGQSYTVVKGDTLWDIAKSKYGNASKWSTIYNNNRSVIGGNPDRIYPGQVLRLDTGGYTGAWGTEGRMAMLHEKELVLNKQDTENMLNAVEVLRNITSTLDANLLTRLASISAKSYNGLGSSEGLQQDVHIDATFPNVTSHTEIEDALNNLVNAAAQRVSKNR